MSIDVAFMSLFVRKDVLEDHFPGGVAGFRALFSYHAEDHYLFRISAMDGRDFQDSLDRLQEAGLNLERDIVIAEMSGGPDASVEGIEFVREQEEDEVFPRWMAMASEESTSAKSETDKPADRLSSVGRSARPKLEVVRSEPESEHELESESESEQVEASDPEPEVLVPPPGEREVVILDQKTTECSIRETVRLERDGELVLAGYDHGEVPRKMWGREDYEYSSRVDAGEVPRILLGLIRERFGSHLELKNWLEANGIDSKMDLWS